jgi:hypothetical protein
MCMPMFLAEVSAILACAKQCVGRAHLYNMFRQPSSFAGECDFMACTGMSTGNVCPAFSKQGHKYIITTFHVFGLTVLNGTRNGYSWFH